MAIDVLEGDAVELECTALVDENLESTFTWNHNTALVNGKHVTNRELENVKGKKRILSKMTIVSSTEKDSGSYVCTAKTDVGL